jgi:uncharacterized protein (TIGR03435 family)
VEPIYKISSKMGRVNLKMTGLALTFRLALAQPQTAARPEFEVASIKPIKGDCRVSVAMGVGYGSAVERCVTLKMLITVAYQLQSFQISGGPGWIDSDRYDVDAKAEDSKSGPDKSRLMLQTLLADRFKLTLRREMKQSPVYELVLAKGGPKIKLSSDQDSPEVNGPPQPGAGPNRGAIRIGAGSLIGNAATLALFTKILSQRLDRPIVDKTNLTGRYDIQLTWTPGVGESPLGPGGYALPPADSDSPSVFAAIQEKLGLKLESAKAPVDVWVVDRAERPTEN